MARRIRTARAYFTGVHPAGRAIVYPMTEGVVLPALQGLQMQSKAASLRGQCDALRARKLLEPVASRCSETTRRLLREPPPVTAWMPGEQLIELVLAIEAVGGHKLVQEISRAGTLSSIAPLVRPLIEGALRLFGKGPGAIFRQLPRFVEQTSRGVTMNFAPTNDRSGVVTMTVQGSPNVPMILFVNFAAALSVTYDICKVPGTVGEPVMKPERTATTAIVQFTW